MNSPGFLIAVLVFGIIWGFCGYFVGKGRGRPGLGAVLGFLLGLIGLLIFICIPRTPEAKARHQREKAARQQPPAGIRPPDSPPSWQPTSQYPAEPGKDPVP